MICGINDTIQLNTFMALSQATFLPALLYNWLQAGPCALMKEKAEMTMSLDALQDELYSLVFKHALELERDVIVGRFHTGKGASSAGDCRKP